VTSIGDLAFYKCKSLTEITIPGSVTSIDDDTFFGCESLTSVTIPAGVTSIGRCAFYQCTGLKSVICYTLYAASAVAGSDISLIYLGGSPSDLPEEYMEAAARGFIYALEQGITEIDPWREEYQEYIRENAAAFVEEAKRDGSVLMYLIKEKLLDEKAARTLLEHLKDSDDIEGKAALLQYLHGHIRAGGTEDIFCI
jgi:hypothetical protein